MKSMQELRERVYACNMDLQRKGLVVYTFGNASAIDRERGIIAIKPSGVPYDQLNPENMVLVDLDNRTIGGDYNPSSDTRTHLALYKNFPEIGGVVHTHSPYATAWAQAVQEIPCLGTTHADHLPVDVPCTDPMSDEQIGGDYEHETGLQIVKRFQDISYIDVPMVLVAGHAPFTWGPTPEKAVYHSVILEELARLALVTIEINPRVHNLQKSLIDRHYQRKHGPGAYYGQ